MKLLGRSLAIVIMCAGLGVSATAGPLAEARQEVGRRTIVIAREGDLWLTGPSGSEPVNLTDGVVEDVTHPSWNPGKTKIVFGCYYEDGANQEICTIGSDGTGFRRLTHTKANDYGPDWSPDGTRIAWIRGGKHRIFVMNARGRREHAIGVQNVGDLGWRFRKTLVVSKGAVDGADLFTIRPSGDRLRRVGKTGKGTEDQAQWSPDGRWVVFVRQVGTRYEDVFKMRRDGSDVTRLTRDCCVKGDPTWSLGGKRILYSNSNLFIMDADGSNVEDLGILSGYTDWS